MERGGKLRFLHEPAAPVLVGGQAGRQNLERDAAAQAGVKGVVHFAHAAGPEEGHDLVRSKARTCGKWHVGHSNNTREGLS